MRKLKLLVGAALLAASAASTAHADQVINDDLIVTFSACIGSDCVNGENFGFDTLRLKENNLRIHFNDTSTSASFPSNDWRIVANDSSNGGANYLAIEDSDTGRIPFRIEAGARANALYVEADSDVGIGTANPVVDLHMVTGNTPTLRLEQDGSNGFTPQVYDIAANEANFFIRDVTNGSALFFRAQPGAPADSMYIANDGDVGMGTASPQSPLHVRRSAGSFQQMLRLENNGGVTITMDNNGSTNAVEWRVGTTGGDTDLYFVTPDSPGPEMTLSTGGNLEILGNFISSGTTLNVPDYVFQEDYELASLEEVRAFIEMNSHLPEIPSAAEIAENGINMSEMQMNLLRKIEELTLYTLAQEDRINALESQINEGEL